MTLSSVYSATMVAGEIDWSLMTMLLRIEAAIDFCGTPVLIVNKDNNVVR